MVAADVYGAPPHVGRGGWTWYTGSAGWMLRVILETLLGFEVEDGKVLVLRPRLPASWPRAICAGAGQGVPRPTRSG